jgi:hypothetical protein
MGQPATGLIHQYRLTETISRVHSPFERRQNDGEYGTMAGAFEQEVALMPASYRFLYDGPSGGGPLNKVAGSHSPLTGRPHVLQMNGGNALLTAQVRGRPS